MMMGMRKKVMEVRKIPMMNKLVNFFIYVCATFIEDHLWLLLSTVRYF